MFSNLISAFLKFIYIPRCIVCRKVLDFDATEHICGECFSGFEFITGNTCSICGKMLKKSHTCNDCSNKTHYFKKNYSFLIYNTISSKMIYNFKYHGHKNYGEHIINFILSYADINFVKEFDYIIPVPLHKKRLKERGYNQAQVLAEYLSLKTGVPVLNDILIRHKNTSKQNILDRNQRKRNIENAFNITNPNEYDLKNKSILLIDDIFTTGSTINECSKILLKKYPSKICSFTITKTVVDEKKKSF